MSIGFKHSVSLVLSVVMLFALPFVLTGCSGKSESTQMTDASVTETAAAETEVTYTTKDYLLSRNGVDLHLDCTVMDGGSHVIMYEKPYYREFQSKLAVFLNEK